MRLENELIKIGLSEKEAKVYLAALELGPTNILRLAKKSGIKRSTVYEMIKNLKEMALISETVKGKRSLIIAAEPEKLKRNITEKEKLLKQILPELKTISNVGFTKPKITYYEGKEGLREIYKIALEAKDKKADWISPITSVTEMVGEEFLNEYVETKKRMGYWIRSIHIIPRQLDTYKYLNPKTYEETLRKVRFAPEEIDVPNAIVIWDNKVAVMSTKKEGFGFIIESDEYTETMKIFYNLLWKSSRPYEEVFNKQLPT